MFEKKVKLKAISLILVASLIFTGIPFNFFGLQASAEDKKTEDVYIVKELENLRDQYSKTYLESDGSNVAVVSATPLHYKETDENGNVKAGATWQDFNYSIETAKDKNNNSVFQAKTGNTSAELPTTADGAFRVSSGKYTLSIKLQDAKSAKSKKSDKTVEKNSVKSGKKVKSATDVVKEDTAADTLSYNNVLDDTDISYNMIADGVKENITLSKMPKKDVRYTYDITASGLTATLNKDNSIDFFKDTDAKDKALVFHLPASFMTDNNDVESYDIKTSITKTKDGYQLTYAPDMTWLQDTERSYPVVIDPTIQTERLDSNFTAVHVLTNNSTNNGGSMLLRVGRTSDNQRYYSYVKMNTLPTLPEGSIVTNATLSMGTYANAASAQTVVNQVTSAWGEYTITGTNMPTYNSAALDYQNQSYLIGSNRLTKWDISSMVSNWYRGSAANYGVRIGIYEPAYTGAITFGYNSGIGVINELKPFVEITYTNQNGNSNASSKNIDVGRAGSIAVNDYTGNLTLTRSDLGFDGNVMPVNISMIYNTNDRNSKLIDNGTAYSAYGAGYRTNYTQTIKYYTPTIGVPYYAYTSESGKIIYFERTETTDENNVTTVEYKDVSNGGYTLTVDLQNLTTYPSVTLKDSSSQRYYFDSSGRLFKIAGNIKATANVTSSSGFVSGTYVPEPGVIAIIYSNVVSGSLAIQKIYDGAGRTYNFVYDSTSKMLTQINNNATGDNLRAVSYAYNTDKTLSSVTYPDNKAVTYEWTASKQLYRAINADNYKFQFTYDSYSVVQRIQEFGTDGSTGSDIGIVREGNETKYFKYADYLLYIQNNTQLPYESMQFNKDGDLTSNLVAGTDEDDVYSVYAQYSSTKEDTASKATNQLMYLSNEQKTATNLIKDPIFANGTALYTVEGGNTTVDSTHALFGSNGVKMVTYGLAQQTLSLEAGRTYTVSTYVYCENNVSGSVHVNATPSYGSSAQIDYTSVEASSTVTESGWKRIYRTFDVTASGNVDVYFALSYSQGTAWFDGFQLEYGSQIGRFNAISNGEFYTDTSLWTLAGNASNGIESGVGRDGGKSLKLVGTAAGSSTATQTVLISGKQGDAFTFGGWGKSGIFASKDGRNFTITLSFLDSSGTVLTADGATQTISFNNAVSQWQYIMGGANAPADFSKIRIDIKFENQVNTAYFDSIQLYKEVFGSNVHYKSDGTMDYIEDIAGVPTSDTSSDSTTEPTPDENGIATSTSQEGVISKSRYDNYGNLVESIITNNRFSINTLTTYTSNGNYTASTTDDLGNQTLYNYSSEKGTLTNTTDANGNTTNYSYDAMGQQTGISQTVSNLSNGDSLSVSYTYDNGDRLSTISHNNFGYTFEYDPTGVLSEIKVGNQFLVSYDYNDDYMPTTTTYGNTQAIEYTYNSAGLLTGMKQSGQTNGVTYSYDSNRKLTLVYDTVNGIYTNFTTDSKGNTITTTRSISSGDITHKFTTADGVYTEQVGSTTYTMNYTYDKDKRLTKSTWSGGGKTSTKEFFYDDLGRTTSTVLYNNDGTTTTQLLNTSYTYNDVAGFKTSEQVAAINLRSQNYNKLLTYSYDKNGNITKAGDVSYVYDEAGQLVRVNDPAYGTTVYVYDVGGNIKYVKSYNYTVGDLGTVQSTKTYAYDAEWKDKLASYDGQGITYDQIGNPLTYRDGLSFTWQMGRQMATATKNGTTYSYKYNNDGLRVSKTTGSTTTYYTWADGKITSQTDGTNTLYFRYDDTGALLGFELNGIAYYYVQNIQGDIIGILDASGNCVVEYTYDAWGKLLATTGSMASTVGQINPLRYRGYYYDTDTGLYYLQSRYYDATVGRFINADDASVLELTQGDTLGANLFAYCDNNPVMNIDPSGYFVLRKWMVAVPLDMLFMAIPAIGGLFAPIKYMAKNYGKMLLKSKLSTPLGFLIRAVAKVAGFLIRGLQTIASKIPFAGKWLASKIPVKTWISMIAGATSSATINFMLNCLVSNISYLFSLGGIISIILDGVLDKKMNDSIWSF